MAARVRLARAVVAGVCTVAATLAAAPSSQAAAWVAVDTIAGSGLAAATETWEATPVDYDGDGDQDVWVGYHDQGGKLWRNDGTGHYTRAAASAWPRTSAEGKVVDRHYCDWADLDRDGRPDAYCSAGRGGGNGVKTGRDNEVWLQRSAGTFTEVGTAWGAGDVCGRSHYVAFVRADADAYPDVFVGNAPPRTDPGDPCDDPANGLPNEDSKLFLNQAGTSLRQATGWGITGNGGVACAQTGDFTGDGRDDLVVCGQPTARLYRNGGSSFTDVAAANHLSGAYTDATFVDLDRDGDLDLVTSAGRNVGYHRNNGGVLAAEVRITTVPSGGSVRSLAVGDADGDGDPDVYVLVSNVSAGKNPNDRILLNDGLQFTSVPVPAAGGIGDKVEALDGNHDGRAEFLVLNGVEVVGPMQRIELRAG